MDIVVVGMNHIGIVAATCLANLGHQIVGYDNEHMIIETLQGGDSQLDETDLDELIIRLQKLERLNFTTDFKETVKFGDVFFICTDEQLIIQTIIENIYMFLEHDAIFVIHGTLAIGTMDYLVKWIGELKSPYQVKLMYVPQFLRKGSAVYDFVQPDRIVIGTRDVEGFRAIREVFSSIPAPVLLMEPKAAELVKHVANTYLAMRVSFINEISRVVNAEGVSMSAVIEGVGYDRRIGHDYLEPSFGYGGEFLRKSVSHLIDVGDNHSVPHSLLSVIPVSNDQQITYLIEEGRLILGGSYKDTTVAIIGVTYKPEVTDIVASRAHVLIRTLIEEEADIRVFDPKAIRILEIIYGSKLSYFNSEEEALEGAQLVFNEGNLDKLQLKCMLI